MYLLLLEFCILLTHSPYWSFVSFRFLSFHLACHLYKYVSSYSNRASVRNGLLGEFGQINIMNKKNNARQDGEGNFQFCFHDHETGDLTAVDSFHWSFYDIDERNEAENGIKEKIRFDTSQVTDFILYPNEQESEVILGCEDGTTTLPCDDGVRTVFHSSTKGTGGDNPKDPQNLTEQQKKRSVVFTFKDTSCFTVTMDHYCAVDNCSWYGGGNFMFSGNADESKFILNCLHVVCCLLFFFSILNTRLLTHSFTRLVILL
jgi:hypothetical protein